jgi:hypothetical protein
VLILGGRQLSTIRDKLVGTYHQFQIQTFPAGEYLVLADGLGPLSTQTPQFSFTKIEAR